MRRIVVTIPDNYNVDNAIKRIALTFDDPKISVEPGENVNGKLGEIIRAVDDFRRDLNRIEKNY